MININTDDFLNLTGAYALDALTEDERKIFEGKLPMSEQLRHEATELTDTAALLGTAVDPVEPSAGLKLKLMELISITPQLAPEEATEAPASVSTFIAPVESIKVGKAEAKANRHWFQRPVFAGLSVAVAASFIVVAATTGHIGSSNVEQSNQANGLATISQASDSQRVQEGFKGGGTATVMWSNKADKSAVFVNNIPHVQAGKSYQLWYVNSKGTARSAGLLSDASVTQGWQVLDGTMKSGDSIGITVEPSGGSKAPTTKPVLFVGTA